MNDEQAKWCAKMPALYRGSYRQAMEGRRPLMAIRAKCLDCTNWQQAEIRNCPVTYCPLYPYRMGRMPRTTAKRCTNPRNG